MGASINKCLLIFLIIILISTARAPNWEGPQITNVHTTPVVDNGTLELQQSSVGTTSILNNSRSSNQVQYENLSVEVASDVYSQKDRRVLYCPKGNYIVVRNRIYLSGKDLNKVYSVKYILHESFEQPIITSNDPNNDFEVWIWTWGGFQIRAVITTKNGQEFEKVYDFSFKSKFEEAQSKRIMQYIMCDA